MANVIAAYVEGWLLDEQLKRDLAKQNYLNIRDRRSKRRNYRRK